MLIMSRALALHFGFKRYFTGKTCRRGHRAWRSIHSRNCSECSNIMSRGNPNKLEYMRRYSEENRDRENARASAWVKQNKERHKARTKAYYEAHKPAVSLINKAWRDRNADRVAAYSRARKSRVRSAEGTWSFSDVESMLDSQSGACVYCAAPLMNGFHVDHIMPLCLGGSNWPENLQLLCPTCNLRKGRKHPEAFAGEFSKCGS